MFLRAGFSCFSNSNFAFDLYHTENMFWFVGNEIGSFELYVRKSSDLVFHQKTRCLKLHSTKSMFWLVGKKIWVLWTLYRKKQRFCFLFAKIRCTHTNSLFALKLCCFQRYCTRKRFFSSLQPVTLLLILPQRTFFICDWLSDYGFASFWCRYAVFSIIFVTTFPTAFSLFNS